MEWVVSFSILGRFGRRGDGAFTRVHAAQVARDDPVPEDGYG